MSALISPSFARGDEGLWTLTGAALDAAREQQRARREALPATVRDAWQREHDAFAAAAHAVCRRFNRSLEWRVAGYVALGRTCAHAYPWPVVAILGLVQVRTGLLRQAGFQIAGAALRRLGRGSTLWRFADGLGDVLRRTNRGIFMDSVPTVILALRAHELRLAGHAALAGALLAGPLPLAMDDTTRDLARALYDGLAIAEDDARFRALAALTLRHFDREQAIFSHHLGPPRPRRPGRRRGLAALLTRPPRGVPAPVISGDRVVTRSFPLPAHFDIRDHDARVRHFGAAFVTSLTRTPAEFRIAVDHVERTWGDGRQMRPALGPAPAPDWSWLDLSW